jgi:hypothetical protein
VNVLIVSEQLPRQEADHLVVIAPGDPLYGIRVDVIVVIDGHITYEWWMTALVRLQPDGRIIQ